MRNGGWRPRLGLMTAVVAMSGVASSGIGARVASATPDFAFTRLAGGSRYDTAAAIATTSFTTADTVVVATGQNFPDALAAAYLAGADTGPILLTGQHVPVPAATLDAISALKTKHVVLAGGTTAIGQDVQSALGNVTSTSASGGSLDVTRASGANRYDTMAAIAQTPPSSHVGSVGGKRTAIVASGENFPDALAAGPLSWARGLPIVLTTSAALSPQAAQVLGALGVEQVLIEGGAGAVSTATEAAIHAHGVTTLARFAGVDRSDTARLTAEYATANLGFSTSHVDLATGDQAQGGADALAGGPHGGADTSPVLVTNSASDAGQAAAYAAAHRSTLATGDALGGSAALPDTTLAVVTDAARGAMAGYDISFPQCASGTYPTSPAFGIVGVNGGKPFTANPCLGSEYQWALAAPKPPQFYVNTAAPGPASAQWNQTDPKPGCDNTADNLNCAYDYGYHAALDAFTSADTATTGGAANHTWWLDVETANSWSSTSKVANAAAVHGFVDFLSSQPGVTVGIYSTGYQWGVITGSPTGFETLPNWVPGAGDQAQAASFCASTPTHSFTGGPVVMTQYPLNGFDGDYLC
ncbi:MAG: hypothetical protein JWO37_1718 [Acidimicrobiales bacterium]|jgi:putative cell wall-binding protein|nr:hypothetical protein [Acidimicrobiales bacterium]